MSSPTATSCISGLIRKRRADGSVSSWPGIVVCLAVGYVDLSAPGRRVFPLRPSKENVHVRHKAGHDDLR
jgi:hypothetical protein